METKQATVGITLDTRKMKADGTYPVKLRVIYGRQYNRMHATKYSLTEDEYKKLPTSTGKKLMEIRNNLSALETYARDIIKQLPEFSFEAFKYKLKGKVTGSSDPQDVYGAFEDYIKEMQQQNRVGNAIAYGCALKSLQKFRPKLTFKQVTVKLLTDYQTTMVEQGNSLTTVGIYLRCLRALVNNAKYKGIISAETYPFRVRKNDNKFVIAAPKGRKKALEKSDIKKIFDYIPTSDNEAMYRDLWIFSYLCNGANMKDICLLKYQNIDGDTITFYREKTKRTLSDPINIEATYQQRMKDIVAKWGNVTKAPAAYLFPILQPADNEKRIKERVAQVVKMVNKYMKQIAEATGIEANVTTYTARHSFATVLNREGEPLSHIQEMLGHSEINTTQNYLASISDVERKKTASKLTDF